MGAVVFNHHSLPLESREVANQQARDFVRRCIKLKNSGSDLIVCQQNWFELMLADGYGFKDFLSLLESDPKHYEMREAFLKFQIESPLFQAEDLSLDSDLHLIEVALKETSMPLDLLKASIWHDKAPLISFPTRDPWNQSPIFVWVDTLTDEATEREEVQLTNIHSDVVLNTYLDMRYQELRDGATDGEAIWAAKDELFPGLSFTSTAETQLRKWTHSREVLNQVKTALTQVCHYLKSQKGAYKGYSHKELREHGLSFEVTGESESCRDNRKLMKQRRFYTPEGDEEVFENHIKVGKYFRIHFFPYEAANDPKICIGYIGKHLDLPGRKC